MAAVRYALRAPLAAAVLALAAPALAQAPPDDATKEAARGLAVTGKKRFVEGDYQGAIDALRDAEKYYRAPTILRLHAQAHEKLGQLVEARDLYQEIAGQELGADASAEFRAAQDDAKQSLEALEARVPRLAVHLENAPAGTRVTLGGKVVDPAAPLRLNPGKHTLSIEPPGKPAVTRDLDLAEGAREEVSLDLAPPPAVAAPSRSLLGPAIAFGAGGLGLIVGAVAGGLTLGKVGEIRALCGDDLVCPRGTEGEVGLDGARAVSHVSTVGFALAGAGIAAGVVLLVLPVSKERPAQVSVTLGPAFAGVKGVF